MKNLTNKKYKGFTLLEMIIIVAIIGIMSTIGVVSLQGSKSASRLKAAQREVASTIKLAQSYALQGKTQSGQNPCGYGVRFVDDLNYEIFYNESPVGSSCEAINADVAYLHHRNDSTSIHSFVLKEGIKLISPPNSQINETEIYFTIPHANTFDDEGLVYSKNQTFRFAVDPSAPHREITFTANGYVNE